MDHSTKLSQLNPTNRERNAKLDKNLNVPGNQSLEKGKQAPHFGTPQLCGITIPRIPTQPPEKAELIQDDGSPTKLEDDQQGKPEKQIWVSQREE